MLNKFPPFSPAEGNSDRDQRRHRSFLALLLNTIESGGHPMSNQQDPQPLPVWTNHPAVQQMLAHDEDELAWAKG